MKIINLLLLTLTLSIATQAQTKEGTIVFEKKINMHRNMPDEQMKAFVPEFSTSKHILLFKDSISLYKPMPQDEMPETENGGGFRMVMSFGIGNAETYKNFSTLQELRATDIAEKPYIIEDSIKKLPWKLTDETKTILGYTCKKAVAKQKQKMAMSFSVTKSTDGVTTDSSKTKQAPKEVEVELVAWYAESLMSPVGPDMYAGLPGLVLEVDSNNGETVTTAVEIKKELNSKELKAPTKGKKITPEEYKKLMKQMMDNMREGGGGIRTMSIGN